MDIAERIKKLREEFEITSNEFAKITGIHPVSIRKYETRKMVPGIEVIDKMCEALKLNRIVFEGLPKQYIDYNYIGDFYQNLFLLLENKTLSYAHKNNPEKNISFSINPILSEYVQIKNGDEVIPIENITIQYNTENQKLVDSVPKFLMYADFLQLADEAINSQEWNEKDHGETKEEYASRLLDLAQAAQLELSLIGHSWKQYMDGSNDHDSLMAELHTHILSGGDYYSYILQKNIPEAKKAEYIESYEEAYIEEILRKELDPYPIDATQEEKAKWTRSLISLISQYKIDHPDFKEMAQKHALNTAALIRKENKTEY